MNIDITYDSSVAAAPAGFTADVTYVVNYLDSLITNNVTVNIDVGWGEIDGQTLDAGALGESESSNYYLVGYSDVVAALKAEGAAGAAGLPATSPFQGSLAITSAQAKAFGFIPASSAVDGYVGFSSALPYSFTPGVTPSPGQYDLVGVLEHEITEILGRVSLLNYQPTYYDIADLYRYSSPGVRDLTTGGKNSTAYFSLDGGATNLGTWNNDPNNGDLADWYPAGPAPGGHDSFNDYTSSGVLDVVSSGDIALMSALGWTSQANVSNTAAWVSANIDGLEAQFLAGTLGTITLTDGGTPTLSLTEAQVAADAGALGKIVSAFTITASGTLGAAAAVAIPSTLRSKLVSGLAVSDTAANVLANLAGLQTLAAAAKLGSVALTNGGTPNLAVTAAQLSADAVALGKIVSAFSLTVSGTLGAVAATAVPAALRADLTAGLAVLDSAANVLADVAPLEVLAAAGHLASITLTDAGAPTITVTAAQLTADAPVLAAIASPFSLIVTGTLPASTAASLPAALTARLASGLSVLDSSTNVVANLAGLQSLAAAGRLASIALTNPAATLTLTAAQLSADAGALGAITSAYSLSITGVGAANAAGVAAQPHVLLVAVADTASGVAASIDALQPLFGLGRLGAITLTNGGTPSVSITEAQLSADAGALGKIVSAFTITASGTLGAAAAAAISSSLRGKLVSGLAVLDTAGAVAANLTGLQAVAAAGKLASVALTDGGTPVLAITAAQLSADATALGKITSSFGIAASGVLAAAAAAAIPAALRAKLTSGLAVVDTGAHVVASLAGLQTLVAAGQLASITLSDAVEPTLSVTAAQLAADAAALRAIGSPFLLAVTGTIGAAAAAATSPALLSMLASGLNVYDSGTNVVANLAGLQALAAGGHLASIALASVTTSTLTLTAAQFAAAPAALAAITSAYNLSITGMTAAGAVGAAAQPHVTLLAISDSAADVVAAIDSLQPVFAAGHLGSIVLTDGGTASLSITEAQLAADAGALGKIVSAFTITVSGSISAAAASAIPASLRSRVVAGLAVADTAANVLANLGGLQAVAAAGKLLSVTLTDGGAPNLSITAAQLSADASALGKIVSAFTITASGTLSAAAAAAVPTALRPKLTSGIAVLDTGAHVVASLTGLQTLAVAGQLASTTLSDATRPTLTITTAQLVADAAALQSIGSAYALTVTGTLGASYAVKTPAALLANLTAGLAVVDSAANVAANLAGLQSLAAAGELASVVLNNSTTPTFTLTTAQLAADPGAIADIASVYVVHASGASAGFNALSVWDFTTTGSFLDLTDMNSASLTASFTENAAGTSGVLTLGDGTHAASITLFGQLVAAGYSGAASAAGVVAVSDGHTGTMLTYNPALAVGTPH
ncbi:MAG TPA: NF038122 family metalloprotease [Caulobacteraceae bacterium]|jgi:hypothetical protein|nr:NF038122 family metalloprotease [Caulobacteraceae bacterium]